MFNAQQKITMTENDVNDELFDLMKKYKKQHIMGLVMAPGRRRM